MSASTPQTAPLLDEHKALRRLAEQVKRVRDHQKYIESDPHAFWMEVAVMFETLDALEAAP